MLLVFDRQGITKILLKVALDTITPTLFVFIVSLSKYFQLLDSRLIDGWHFLPDNFLIRWSLGQLCIRPKYWCGYLCLPIDTTYMPCYLKIIFWLQTNQSLIFIVNVVSLAQWLNMRIKPIYLRTLTMVTITPQIVWWILFTENRNKTTLNLQNQNVCSN
jgi:hypothetical protein